MVDRVKWKASNCGHVTEAFYRMCSDWTQVLNCRQIQRCGFILTLGSSVGFQNGEEERTTEITLGILKVTDFLQCFPPKQMVSLLLVQLRQTERSDCVSAHTEDMFSWPQTSKVAVKMCWPDNQRIEVNRLTVSPKQQLCSMLLLSAAGHWFPSSHFYRQPTHNHIDFFTAEWNTILNVIACLTIIKHQWLAY